MISYKASDVRPEWRSFENKNHQLTTQTFLKILMKQFCFLHKLKAFPLCIKCVYLQIPKGHLTSALTVCYRTHSEILFPKDNGWRNWGSTGPGTQLDRGWTSYSRHPACIPTAAGTRVERVLNSFCVRLFLSSTVPYNVSYFLDNRYTCR